MAPNQTSPLPAITRGSHNGLAPTCYIPTGPHQTYTDKHKESTIAHRSAPSRSASPYPGPSTSLHRSLATGGVLIRNTPHRRFLCFQNRTYRSHRTGCALYFQGPKFNYFSAQVSDTWHVSASWHSSMCDTIDDKEHTKRRPYSSVPKPASCYYGILTCNEKIRTQAHVRVENIPKTTIRRLARWTPARHAPTSEFRKLKVCFKTHEVHSASIDQHILGRIGRTYQDNCVLQNRFLTRMLRFHCIHMVAKPQTSSVHR